MNMKTFNKKWGILALAAAAVVLAVVWTKIKTQPVQNLVSNQAAAEASVQKNETAAAAPSKYETVAKGVSPLTGLPYQGDGKAIIVQIGNTSAARPQSGITKADLIYEMEVESYITRLTAFFLSDYPTKVGPIRSVRKQHMYLWSEWNYMYVFWGGSAKEGQDVDKIRNSLGITAKSINGMTTSAGLFRSSDRVAPHNAYANLEYMKNNAYSFEPKQRTLYFDENASIEGSPATNVSLSYSPDNKIKYEYDNETKLYVKYINGSPVVDKEDGSKLSVKNVIVQHARHYFVEGTVYTNIDLVGSGKAEYFTEGKMRTGTWERKSTESLTRYYDENGKEIAFKPGTTFIQIVRPETAVTAE